MATKSKKTKPADRIVRLPRVSNGIRPEFHDDPAVDQLFAIVTALAGELSVVYDRLDTLERALVDARALAAGSIEAFVPDSAAAEVRAKRRAELIARVFAVFEVYAAQRRSGTR